jgi:hypothetical protein
MAGRKDLPTWYMVSEQDNAIPHQPVRPPGDQRPPG